LVRTGGLAPSIDKCEGARLGKRGPVPESLSRLFRLKYQEGISDRKELAEKLGVSTETIRRYEYRLERKLITRLRQVSEDRLQFVCPECLEAKVYEDRETGERVCRSCGIVLPRQTQLLDERLPFDTTYALESELAVGKSLGSTLERRGYFQVLARSGHEDLGIRARHIRTLAETSEPPRLANLLKRAYDLSKSFSLEGDKIFNNDLGRNVRRAFWLCRELELNLSGVAETAFLLTASQYGRNDLVSKANESLAVNHALLNLVLKLNHFLLTIKTEKPPTEAAFHTKDQKIF